MCLLAACFAGSALLAQPADDAPGASEREELLELPSFRAPEKPAAHAPIVLELLPEGGAESAAESDAPTVSMASEPYGPPLPPAQAPALLELEPEPSPAPPPVVAEVIPEEGQEMPAPGPTLYAESFGPPAPGGAALVMPVDPMQPTPELAGPSLPAGGQVITAAADEPQGPPMPSEAVTPIAPTVPDTGLAAITEDPLKDGWDEGSVMFSSNEVRALQDAIIRAERGEPEVSVEELPEGIPAAPVEEAPLPPEYAAFYVNSILYFSPENWMVWINGKKFFSGKESPLERVSVQSVDKKTVTLLWEPVTRPQSTGESEANSVEFEPDGKVKLVLAANQIFMVPNMQVLEGRGMTAKVKEMLARNEAALAAKELNAMAQGSTISPLGVPNRDRANMDKLVSQYRQAGDMLPVNTTTGQ